jgi:hypothetical protein
MAHRDAHPVRSRLISASAVASLRTSVPATADSQDDHERRHAPIWRCSGKSSELRLCLMLIFSGRNPLRAAGKRDGPPFSWQTLPVRNDFSISGPVARLAR